MLNLLPSWLLPVYQLRVFAGLMKKFEGLEANMGLNPDRVAVPFQAKIERSLYFLIISSWSRRKAFWPSPYNIGILTSSIPIRLYDMSSILVVWRSAIPR
jgi:hypothetical protein